MDCEYNREERDLAQGEADGLPLGTLADLRVDAGRSQTNCGNPARGVVLLEQAVRDFEELYGAGSDKVLDVRGLLGRALTEARRYDEAEDLLLEVLVEREHRLGADHELTLIARGNLGRCVRMSGRPQEALLMAATLLEDRQRVLGAQHPSTLDSTGHVAHALGCLGRYTEAADLFDQQAGMRTVVFGPDHWATQQSHHNALTMRCRAAGSDADVEDLERMVAQCVRDLGEEHSSTLAARGLLAECLQRTGELDRASAVLGQLVSDRSKLLGPTAPSTLTSRRMLIEAQLSMGQVELAMESAAAFLCDVQERFPSPNVDGISSTWTVALVVAAAIDGHLDGQLSTRAELELLEMFEDLAEVADDAACAVLEPDHPLRAEIESTMDEYWDQMIEAFQDPEE